MRATLTSPKRRLMPVVAALAAAVTVVGLALSAAAPWKDNDAYTPPKIGHVWTIILENKSYESTFTGLNQNDYLWKTLPMYGELLRQYYGTGHNSLDNYISAVSGQAPTPDTQADCPQYSDVTPGTATTDGQTVAQSGCVYPASVQTLFNQLDDAGTSWKVYAQDMGNDPTREDINHCGIPGDPSGGGVPDPGSATAQDQYVAKHNPAAWFHSVFDNAADCAKVVPLDGAAASGRQKSISGLAQDLKSITTTPAFSWISPNNCSDAHDATCAGDNLSGDPNDHQGGLYAADLFLEKWIPTIMASPAYQKDGMIQIIFDEATPPYKMYGNSIADQHFSGDSAFGTDSKTGKPVEAEVNTAQSVVACCSELPGPNTTQPGNQAYGQDTTPGGGITGALVLSRFVTPGSVSDQPYNHYSWLRSMEDLFGISKGGTDGKGHLGYAAADGLRPFGPDVYNNPSGKALPPQASGSVVYPATASMPTRAKQVKESSSADLDSLPIPRASTSVAAATATTTALVSMGDAVQADVATTHALVRATGPVVPASSAQPASPQANPAQSGGTVPGTVTVSVTPHSGSVTLNAADFSSLNTDGAGVGLTPVGPATVTAAAGTTATLQVRGDFSAGSGQITWSPGGKALAVWDFTEEID